MTAANRGSRQVEYRAATVADIEGQHAVFLAAEGALLERHGFPWSTTPLVAAAAATYRHLMRYDGERCFVAEAHGRVVGYSAVFVRGDTCYLAALFIEPAQQGIGVGQRLLELAFDGAPARRITISDSIQPISNAIYARHGMLPMTPILQFRGEAGTAAPTDLVAAGPVAAALAHLDGVAYGFDRAIDHSFWASQATPTLWLRDGEPVAYSYRWPSGKIGPLVGRDEAGAADALCGELAIQPSAIVQIPGTSRSLVRAAFSSGLRLVAPAGLLLLSDGVDLPRTLAISSYGLY